MKIGVFSFNTEDGVRADRLAAAAEERGFESFWVPEHTHIPVPPNGVVLGPDGTVLPDEYKHMSDPFVSLAGAAAATRSIRLGTSVCLVNQHHPIALAKQVATLDRLCDGRFVFGVGAGWNKAEMAHHGVRFEDRWRETVERLAALKALWSEDQPSFSGRFVRFDALWCYPKPLQRPHPPIVLGTLDTPFGRQQVAKHADGWLPLTFELGRAEKSIADVRARMRALGRHDSALAISLFFLEDKEQSADTLRAARGLGAERAILRLPVGPEAAVLARLDRYAALVR